MTARIGTGLVVVDPGGGAHLSRLETHVKQL
jgi:hypothetical protein